jgi:hypothetical protein
VRRCLVSSAAGAGSAVLGAIEGRGTLAGAAVWAPVGAGVGAAVGVVADFDAASSA